ncbi:MAG: response regulator, partial [Steroidobacteraceae bacterium]
EGRPYLHVDGADVALVPAEEVLELEGNGSQMPTCSVLVVAEGARKYGLIVDRFVGESSLVVRPLDTRLGELPDVAAYSTDDAGQIILFLDGDQLVRGIDALVSEGRLRRPGRQRDRHGEGPERRRILVVDDSLTVRQAERQLLENAGYLVEVAVDGVEAWSAVRLGAYDLVVTDVDMPRMNGIELVRRIRGDARLERLPVVVVSYKDREEDRLRGLEVGADRYLAKGGLLDQALVEAVLDLIGGPER